MACYDGIQLLEMYDDKRKLSFCH